MAYPQGNGQAEATNKTLLNILRKLREKYPNSWDEQIPIVLWAYRTTGFTHYSLVYGAEAILSKKLVMPSAKITLAHHLLPISKHVQL